MSDKDGLLTDKFSEKITSVCGGTPAAVADARPLVHLLTNYVTVTDCVNALLAVGARAICSHAPQEAAEVCAASDALVCNLGGTEYYESMDLAAAEALRRGIPLVIDPVGCSASTYRREKCLRMIADYRPAAVRGNYAEITSLIEGHSEGGGLDSDSALSDESEHGLKSSMLTFAGEHQLILIASGAVDLCTDGNDFVEVSRGTPALKRITGAGCMSSALLGAFLAADRSLASAVGLQRFVALCGEAAVDACRKSGLGAGHFHTYFMDALSAVMPL